MEEEENLLEVLCVKNLSVEGKEVSDIQEGDVGADKYRGSLYPVKILGKSESKFFLLVYVYIATALKCVTCIILHISW